MRIYIIRLQKNNTFNKYNIQKKNLKRVFMLNQLKIDIFSTSKIFKKEKKYKSSTIKNQKKTIEIMIIKLKFNLQ